jgi:cation-transporting ATPase E
MSEINGLTNSQVLERRNQGLGNEVELTTSRSYKDIFMTNVFNPVNIVLYVIGLGMLLVGDFRSAFATVMLVIFNAAVGIIQEVRAKKQLDEIALLAVAKITVRRDGQEQQIDPAELVQDDVLAIRAGDQIPVDGTVISEAKMEVDESALTGESDLISKTSDDKVLSGSFAVTGEALVEATGVGEQSFANKLTKDAREFKLELTPLQREVNRLLRLLLLIVLFFAILAVLALFVLDLQFDIWLQILAVITGSVSAGLLTLITLNYSWGAVRIGQQGGLVQQINAIESLSNVTVLCTDKTGTLTANKIKYNDVYPVGLDKPEVERLLADFAASAGTTNKTSEAIIAGLPGAKREVTDEVPFSSARKWSAIAFDSPATDDRSPLQGAYVLGALEMLQELFAIDETARQRLEEWSDQGLRVLVFARNPDVTSLHNAAEEPTLPRLTLLGVVSFSDELVELKVISGDNPQTVAALAKQAGLPGDLKAVSGPELADMSPAELTQTAVESTVFGRITPQQKEALVDTLRSQGEYVAMMGDGVNDVLSLKKANMGIAMESGSTATRSVAAMILLGDSFEVMPAAFSEGQRIVNSIQNILKLFMATVFALLLLIIGISFLQIGFPFTTLQSTLLSFFARGAPPLILAVAATAGLKRGSLYTNMMHFTLPASFLIFFFGLLIYIGTFFIIEQKLVQINLSPETMVEIGRHVGQDFNNLSPEEFSARAQVFSAQTALTSFFVLAGVLLMVFAEPPIRWLAGGAPYSGKWMPTIAAVVLIVAYAIILFALPRVRGVLLMTVIWVFVQRAVWRARSFERFLDLDDSVPDVEG